MQKNTITGTRLGILGGGQLGLMLLQSAMNYGIHTGIMDPDAACSCRAYTSDYFQGDLNDEEAVFEFGRSRDIVTIEIENVSVSGLIRLEQAGVKVYPQAHIVGMIQDKGHQKRFFSENAIPTAPWVLVEDRDALNSWLNMLPGVMKSRKAGYDGKGVVKIKHRNEIGRGFNVPSILEEQIDFRTEISVIVARNVAGEIEAFDVVEMEFNPDANLVEFLISPARISWAEESIAKATAVRIISELGMVGVLAVEMFVTQTGEILVNELAPRPHNSGHHTIEANYVSQYEQHLRAILNLHLGSTKRRSGAVLVNLIGASGSNGPAIYQGLDVITDLEGVFVHLYGKKTARENRKMGHVTIIDDDPERALAKGHFVFENLRVISAPAL